MRSASTRNGATTFREPLRGCGTGPTKRRRARRVAIDALADSIRGRCPVKRVPIWFIVTIAAATTFWLLGDGGRLKYRRIRAVLYCGLWCQRDGRPPRRGGQ